MTQPPLVDEDDRQRALAHKALDMGLNLVFAESGYGCVHIPVQGWEVKHPKVDVSLPEPQDSEIVRCEKTESEKPRG